MCTVAMTYLALLCFFCLIGHNFSSSVPTENATSEIPLPHFSSTTPDDLRDLNNDVKEMIKKKLLKILHLSEVPEDDPRNVPEYMQALFGMIETNASASVKLEPNVSGERAALAIKAFDAQRDDVNLSTYFNVFLEFNSNMISRVELVFEGTSDSEKPSNQSNQRQTPQNVSAAVEVCDANGTVCHRSDTVTHRRLDGAKSTYDIYDVTRPFVQWWASVASCKSCVAQITVAWPPFIESFTDVNTNDLLLIIYQNMTPDITMSHQSAGPHHSTPAPNVASSPRVRRDVRRNGGSYCQLREWYIDFHRLGWNWIIVPNVFSANICDGSCTTLPHDLEQVNMTNHAFLRTVHRAIISSSLNKDDIPVPASTCVPIRYRPLNILYKANNETFIVRTIVDMVATSCGCL